MTEFEREFNLIEDGKRFYVNAINLSEKEIDFMRSAIRTGRMFPAPENYEMFSKAADVWYKVATGEIIAPQGEYVKNAAPVHIRWHEAVYQNGRRIELAEDPDGSWYAYREDFGGWYLWHEYYREMAIDAAVMGLFECADFYASQHDVEMFLSTR